MLTTTETNTTKQQLTGLAGLGRIAGNRYQELKTGTRQISESRNTTGICNTYRTDELARNESTVWTINTLGNETRYAGFWDVRWS